MPSIVVTLVMPDGRRREITVDTERTVRELKAGIQRHMGIPEGAQQLVTFANQLMEDDRRISTYNLADREVVMLLTTAPAAPSRPNPAIMQRMMDEASRDPVMARVMDSNPRLRAALQSRDMDAFWRELAPMLPQLMAARQELDENDPEVQRRIMEQVRAERVQAQFEDIMEHQPELVVGSVTMLYIDVWINDHSVKAFVDSGAQITVMSMQYATELGLEPWIDTRFEGFAVGVGKAKIVGKIHAVKVKVGTHNINCAITILDNNKMDFLFGLDNLKRHRCSIDLNKNHLYFPEVDTALPFLSESEIPKKMTDMEDEAEAGVSGGDQGQPGQQGTTPAPAADPAVAASNGGANAGAGAAAGAAVGANREPGGATGGQVTAAPAAPATALPAGVSEASVKQLEEMGFPRSLCIEVLQQCGGNLDLAASILFG